MRADLASVTRVLNSLSLAPTMSWRWSSGGGAGLLAVGLQGILRVLEAFSSRPVSLSKATLAVSAEETDCSVLSCMNPRTIELAIRSVKLRHAVDHGDVDEPRVQPQAHVHYRREEAGQLLARRFSLGPAEEARVGGQAVGINDSFEQGAGLERLDDGLHDVLAAEIFLRHGFIEHDDLLFLLFDLRGGGRGIEGYRAIEVTHGQQQGGHGQQQNHPEPFGERLEKRAQVEFLVGAAREEVRRWVEWERAYG